MVVQWEVITTLPSLPGRKIKKNIIISMLPDGRSMTFNACLRGTLIKAVFVGDKSCMGLEKKVNA